MKKWQELAILGAFVALVGFVMFDFVVGNVLKVEVSSSRYSSSGIVSNKVQNISGAFLTEGADVVAAINVENGIIVKDVILSNTTSQVSYLFDIENDGKVRSMLTSYSAQQMNPDAYHVELTYADGTSVGSGDIWEIGSIKTLRVTISYDGVEPEEVYIPQLTFTFEFEQA